MNARQTNFWLDSEVAQILEHYPDSDEIVVSSGISPSASYHIGHFPEVLMAEALTWGIRRAGRPARHLHVVDNMDPLRRRYGFLPPEYEQYVGWPICLVPNPYGAGSYADHFFDEFKKNFQAMGIKPGQIVRSYENLYQTGLMAPQIERVLERLELVKAIFTRHGRKLPADWTPVQVKTADNHFVNARPDTWDKAARSVEGIDYTKGGAKLNWRLDWPARWAVLGVQVEPFNIQEHGAASGSYATGKDFSREIFDYSPPLPAARYGNVYLNGDTVKMSSSKGNLITPAAALAIMPPSLLRYFMLRSRPEKALDFNTGAKFINLFNEYKQVAAAVARGEAPEFAAAYRLADTGDKLSTVPFEHLVSAYQSALGDTAQTAAILARSGYRTDAKVLDRELQYVRNWLQDYAPEEVKFRLQTKLPDTGGLSAAQEQFLSALAAALEAQPKLEAEWVHATIYELKDRFDLKPAECFQAIYRVLLGQASGPKAGWFLTSLDKDWLVKRLRLEA